ADRIETDDAIGIAEQLQQPTEPCLARGDMAPAMHREDDRAVAAAFRVMRLHAIDHDETGPPCIRHQLTLSVRPPRAILTARPGFHVRASIARGTIAARRH